MGNIFIICIIFILENSKIKFWP